jgi:hypothetical protein
MIKVVRHENTKWEEIIDISSSKTRNELIEEHITGHVTASKENDMRIAFRQEIGGAGEWISFIDLDAQREADKIDEESALIWSRMRDF